MAAIAFDNSYTRLPERFFFTPAAHTGGGPRPVASITRWRPCWG